MVQTPSLLPFSDFFELGQKETVSPFITQKTRLWGANLNVKTALLAALCLTISFILTFFPYWLPLSYFFLATVYFLAGIPSLIESIEDLLNLDINIDILMTLAAFSSVLIGSGLEGGLLLVLFALSGSMEEAVRTKASSTISQLHQLSPNTAFHFDESGQLIEKSVKDISIGTKILVKAGQIIPLDGEVMQGASSINLEHLTGENFPVTKTIGDQVPGGARNLDGALVLKVNRTSADSTVAKIIDLVTQAQEAQPRLQRWFDRLSKTYATSIILLTFLFAVSFPFLINITFLGSEGSLYRALAFLIAASPCALIIAIPIAYLSAVSVCAKRGILLKGGVVLDDLAKCRAMAFDKTGTLTTGSLDCLGIESLDPAFQDKLLALSVASGLEQNAIHPIAKATIKYAKSQGVKPAIIQDFKAIPGYGLEGAYRNLPAQIGLPELIAKQLPEAKAAQLLQRAEKIRQKGELVAALKIDEEVWLMRFLDTPRPHMRQTLSALKKHWNLALIMLTGDHEESARRIALEIGLDKYHAHLTPEDKLNYVSKLSQQMGLAMVGDGINDAPALARATVGICMGKLGMTAAMEASDIVLLQDNIELLDWLVGKSHQTQQIVKQNLILATAAIIGASLPALCGLVPLWAAVLLHEGGTLLVGLNALRLLKK